MDNSNLHVAQRILNVLVIGDTSAALAEAQAALRHDPRMRITLLTNCFEHLNRNFGVAQPSVIVVVNTTSARNLEQLTSRLAALFTRPRIIVVQRPDSLELNNELLRMGCRGLLPQVDVRRQLHKAVVAVAGGELWLSRSTLARLVEMQQATSSSAGSPMAEEAIEGLLTQGEKRIMAHVVKGMTNKEIARVLGISDKTVKTHISHILKKFGVARRQQMIFGVTDLYRQSQRQSQPMLATTV
jgi:two-component system, NarL family, nitrate/nitrite response regulator NarL